MLVLSRSVRQRIFIGEAPNIVEVEVLEISKTHVRLGITAAKDVPIYREEVRERMRQKKTDRIPLTAVKRELKDAVDGQ